MYPELRNVSRGESFLQAEIDGVGKCRTKSTKRTESENSVRRRGGIDCSQPGYPERGFGDCSETDMLCLTQVTVG